MGQSVTIPVWTLVVLSLTFILVVIRVAVFPLWASFWSVRSRHVVEEIDPRLQLHLSPFTLTRRRVLADRLASDEAVEEKVLDLARQRGQPVEKLRRECWRIAWDIVPGFNPYFYFRMGYRLARSALRSLYRIRIAFQDEESMATAGDQDAVVFIINHRSNMDYVVANFLTAERTMLSFGVGEWSRMWPVQSLMRMAGGYFVRRDSHDPLYRLLLKRYVQMATAARVPHAIFLEGRLSPDGRVGDPRLGLLSYITENFDPVATPELVFIPVGINYDRVVEDENMVRFSADEFRHKGRPYVAWNLLKFVTRLPWEMLRGQRNYGYACAVFGKPIFFSTWLAGRKTDWPALNRDQRYAAIRALGQDLVGHISCLVPAMPFSILCTSWLDDLTATRSGRVLENHFGQVVDRLNRRGCHTVLVDNDIGETLRHALSMATDRNVILAKGGDRYRINPAFESLVRYYANSIAHFLSGDMADCSG